MEENIVKFPDTEFSSEVKIAEDVIATVAVLAATEVEGIASTQGNLTNEIVRSLGMKNKTKGVTVRFNEDKSAVSVELNLIMQYGYSIPKTCKLAQEKVKSAVENMVGLKCNEVSINIVEVNTENVK
ncbi:MAG: Asp23/Gls24 family envelope stress response protein [Lachnospiraceae bacterium]|nr:Asp23/Gls24 family envelope stress response protein [Lachnospiraceae bacterium]